MQKMGMIRFLEKCHDSEEDTRFMLEHGLNEYSKVSLTKPWSVINPLLKSNQYYWHLRPEKIRALSNRYTYLCAIRDLFSKWVRHILHHFYQLYYTRCFLYFSFLGNSIVYNYVHVVRY